ncbi:sugar phosphate isomerase/epimerase family protein [Paenibacillus glycanilyticus]|uniref:sugar phosphate isomerase/epimerase family protein n=1 Tax=Paenibacillus glycanilyticus TaxID=126569 RepID=UPI000FD7B6CC|nr:sugar phosphate isomerase/epimerase [Paenibacillus glycanilyticus]
MKLHVYKALWGMEGTYEEQLGKASAAGYYGIEAPLPPENDEHSFKQLLKRYDLSYIAQIVTHGDHSSSFAELVKRAATFQPVHIVAHSAKDSMSEDDQDRFYEQALRVEQEWEIPIGHETHRGRAMFTPWTTARLLRKFPELRITADFSHWVNVCESHLEDQEEDIALAVSKTIHIHGRVGYPEGPQIPHPASPYFQKELKLFMGWWQDIFRHQKDNGRANATFTAEFGPPGYMHTDPFTNKPIADLWEVNEWMADMVKENFNRLEWKGKLEG